MATFYQKSRRIIKSDHNFGTALPIYVVFDNIIRKSLIGCGMWMAASMSLDLFSMGLHTRTAVALLTFASARLFLVGLSFS